MGGHFGVGACDRRGHRRIRSRVKAQCPICGGREFADYNDRTDARCVGCGALERTRYLWLLLRARRQLIPGKRILHVAPETCLAPKLHDLLGNGYHPVDLVPARYANGRVEVKKFDLCTDTHLVENASYDVVMHLHVLEHLPCPLEVVLRETIRILEPGGSLIFGLPIGPGITIENLWPDVPEAERVRVFGQKDHLRKVGELDFPLFLKRILAGLTDGDVYHVDPDALAPRAELEGAAIPYDRVKSLTGDALFHIRKATTSTTVTGPNDA